MKPIIATLLIVPALVAAVGAAVLAQTSTPGNADSIWVTTEQQDSLHWEATVFLHNTDILVAMTLPLRWGNGQAPFRIDSATYGCTRVAYFALKTYLVDTSDQSVLIGLISDLGRGLPPLEPGRGPIAVLHFTARHQSVERLSIDSTFIPPQNTLQVVTPDVRAVTPNFEVRKSGAQGEL